MTDQPNDVQFLAQLGTDAMEWAVAFMERFDVIRREDREAMDESLMVGWFANAIEAGRDAGERTLRRAMIESEAVVSACPCCNVVDVRRPYDIGSGPELSCAQCEWCWGAEGQDLKPLERADALLARLRERGEQAAERAVPTPAEMEETLERLRSQGVGSYLDHALQADGPDDGQHEFAHPDIDHTQDQ